MDKKITDRWQREIMRAALKDRDNVVTAGDLYCVYGVVAYRIDPKYCIIGRQYFRATNELALTAACVGLTERDGIIPTGKLPRVGSRTLAEYEGDKGLVYFDFKLARTFDGAGLTWRQSRPNRAAGLFDGDGVLWGVIMPCRLPKPQEDTQHD